MRKVSLWHLVPETTRTETSGLPEPGLGQGEQGAPKLKRGRLRPPSPTSGADSGSPST